MIGPEGATTDQPGTGDLQVVDGYVDAVLADLDRNLAHVRELRAVIGPGWDPLPTYQFHLQLAATRLSQASRRARSSQP